MTDPLKLSDLIAARVGMSAPEDYPSAAMNELLAALAKVEP